MATERDRLAVQTAVAEIEASLVQLEEDVVAIRAAHEAGDAGRAQVLRDAEDALERERNHRARLTARRALTTRLQTGLLNVRSDPRRSFQSDSAAALPPVAGSEPCGWTRASIGLVAQHLSSCEDDALRHELLGAHPPPSTSTGADEGEVLEDDAADAIRRKEADETLEPTAWCVATGVAVAVLNDLHGMTKQPLPSRSSPSTMGGPSVLPAKLFDTPEACGWVPTSAPQALSHWTSCLVADQISSRVFFLWRVASFVVEHAITPMLLPVSGGARHDATFVANVATCERLLHAAYARSEGVAICTFSTAAPKGAGSTTTVEPQDDSGDDVVDVTVTPPSPDGLLVDDADRARLRVRMDRDCPRFSQLLYRPGSE